MEKITLQKITLQHYRCFENLLIEFSDKVNLLIGDNASGKTTIIRAASTALSSFFTGFSDGNSIFRGLAKDDFREIKGDSSLVNEKPIKVYFEWLGTKNTLELRSIKSRTLKMPRIKEKGEYLYNHLFKDGKQVLPLPLLASFLTADIHKPRYNNKKIFKEYEHKPSFGYFECLQGNRFIDHWSVRLLCLQEANRGDIEVKGVLNAIALALGEEGCGVIKKAEIRFNKGKVYYHFIDGREMDTDKLSDGLRRLVSIVLDISFRCMLLNKGIYGIDACEQTEGTVLIDEIDLHLHPSLQLVVMKGLQKAFPQLQFIITSHAPMIMTGIRMDKDNKIIKLAYNTMDGNYTANYINAYGLDASTIVSNILEVVPRSQEVEEQLKNLFDDIDNGAYESASQKLNNMRAFFGDSYLPELSKAETMLNFLKDFDNDSNSET